MNIASIDIGSNTVLLYIAKVDNEQKRLITLCNKYEIPRLGKGLAQSGAISSEKQVALLEVLKAYKMIIDEHQCQVILAHSTYPLRTARNSAEIISKIKLETGIDVNVIDGDTEARFSFLGATQGLENETPCVIDIGGGSTELSIGQNKILRYKKSVPIGAVNLTEQFLHQNHPSGIRIKEFSELTEFISITLKQNYCINEKITTGIAIAGTPTTLSCMKHNLKDFDEEKINGSILTLGEMGNFIEELSQMTVPEIVEEYGEVVKGRADILVTGTLLLKKLMEFLSLESITVSSKGLRHGAIIDYLFKKSGTYFE